MFVWQGKRVPDRMEQEDKFTAATRPTVTASMGGEGSAIARAPGVPGQLDETSSGGGGASPVRKEAGHEAVVTPANAQPETRTSSEPGRAQDASRGQDSVRGQDSPRGQELASEAPKKRPKAKTGKQPNNVRKLRIERMMSKAELARRAGLSVLTIDRVEKGFGCRMDSKRKILEALGLSLADRVRVFGEEE